MHMAVRGNTGMKSTSDMCYGDLHDVHSSVEVAYSIFPDDFMVFAFSKCVTDSLGRYFMNFNTWVSYGVV